MIENIKNHKLYVKHDFDTIFSSLYEVYKKNFLTLFIAGFIASLAIQYMSFYFMGIKNFDSWFTTQQFEQAPTQIISNMLLVALISLVVYSLLFVFYTYFLMKKQENSTLNPWGALGEATRRYFPQYLILTLITMLMLIIGGVVGIIAIIIGSLLAVIYLGTALFVSGPAMIAENTDPFTAIGQSFRLTHKDFWTTLGMVVVFFIILILINFILGAIVAIPGVIIFFSEFFASESPQEFFSPSRFYEFYNMGILTIFISSLLNALTLPLSAIFSILVYYRLKKIEETQ